MPKKIKANPNLMQIIIDSYRATGSCHATAAALGVGSSTVYRVTRAFGLSKERTGPKLEKQKHVDASLLKAMHSDGKSAAEMASVLGVSAWVILNRLRSEGLSPRKRGCQPTFFTQENIQKAVELYEAGLSQRDIGLIFGASQPTVGKILRANGVESATHASGRRHGSWMGGMTKNRDGYVLELVPISDQFAPMRNSTGYVLQHRLVMARYLGRPLYKHETVHHIDGNRENNDIQNLQLRIGAHGAGIALHCAKCGSIDLSPAKLEGVD